MPTTPPRPVAPAKPRVKTFLKLIFGCGAKSPPTQLPPVPAPSNDQSPAEMLEQPQFFVEPVFPRQNYLQAFATIWFRQILVQSKKEKLIEHVQVSSANEQMVMLIAVVGSLGFWAIDLEHTSARGVSGREEFLDRVKEPVRRPPPQLAAVVAEQHILAKGVAKIQIEGELLAGGKGQLCPLKTIGWYVAQLMIPRVANGPATRADKV